MFCIAKLAPTVSSAAESLPPVAQQPSALGRDFVSVGQTATIPQQSSFFEGVKNCALKVDDLNPSCIPHFAGAFVGAATLGCISGAAGPVAGFAVTVVAYNTAQKTTEAGMKWVSQVDKLEKLVERLDPLKGSFDKISAALDAGNVDCCDVPGLKVAVEVLRDEISRLKILVEDITLKVVKNKKQAADIRGLAKDIAIAKEKIPTDESNLATVEEKALLKARVQTAALLGESSKMLKEIADKLDSISARSAENTVRNEICRLTTVYNTTPPSSPTALSPAASFHDGLAVPSEGAQVIDRAPVPVFYIGNNNLEALQTTKL